MELGIVIAALLIVDAALFAFARRRNRRIVQARMDRALKMHVNQGHGNIRTERCGL